MKTRTVLRLVLAVCLLLAVAIPASADVSLPSGLVEIEAQAFMDSSWLRGSCVIPEGVTTIGAQAFYDCTGLTTLVIPDTVTSIGSQAFYGCTGLTGTIILPEGCEAAEDAFDNCPNLTVISASEAVDPATLFRWTTANGEVTITAYIGDTTITSVTVPAAIDGLPVTTIASYAFSSNRYLISISLPHTLTTINNHAFSYCARLQSLTMPTGVTTIGRYAFYYCSSLQGTLQLIDAEIPSNAFTGCKGLTVLSYTSNADGTLALSRMYGSAATVKVPATCGGRVVTAIGREAFSMRTTLNRVELPATITSIGQSAFYYCTALEYVNLPDCVTAIGPSAFYNCAALESIHIPASVASIGSMAFYSCTSLYDTMYFVDTAVSSGAFDACADVEVWCFTSKADGSLELASCTSIRSDLVVPTAISGRAVTSMAPHAFYFCSAVTDITLPSCFTAICDEAFYQLDTLEDITIPAGVTFIGYGAFNGCSALNSIDIPAAVTTIDAQAFYGCSSLTALTINSLNTSVGAYAFASCTNLDIVEMPNGFSNVGNMAFSGTPWLRERFADIARDLAAGCSCEYDMALVFHDWLIENTAYDLSYTHYGPEGVLFHGLGVCNAYTMTYSMMLDAMGISNMTVTGTATDKGTGNTGGHAWTLVQLEGEWYHVDTTWDDPIPDGRERHTYFCLTDAQMAEDHQWTTANYPAANGSAYSASGAAAMTMSLEDEDDSASVMTLSKDADDDCDDRSNGKKNNNNNRNDKKN